MKWRSRKFYLTLFVGVVWLFTIVMSYSQGDFEFARFITPYVISLIGVYLGVNVWQKISVKR